ncbi:MAG: polyketide synthase, partial [Verrucomicrobiales bacterium]|nr:polyketide synthase [Verrucomicrobiales bacterium]
IDDLSIEPIQLRTPDVLEIQIQVRAFSINFGDWLCIRGLYPTMPEYPFVPGFEVAGFVSEVGSGVTRFKIGDPVIALTGANFGGQAETVVVDERLVVAKPEEISFEDAAAFPVVFLTALRAFERAQVRAGEKVLIQTAAGGTGLMLVQLAQKAGAEIFATAGSQDKLEYLTRLGVQHVINYRTSDFATEIRSLNNGRGIDVVFNTLSGDAIQKGFDLLEPNGRYIEIALSGLRSSKALDLSRLTKNQSIHSINLLELHRENLETVPAYLDEMVRHLREGKIIPTVAKVIPFSEIKEAFRELELRRNIGKIVVRVPDRRSKVESKLAEANQPVQRIAVVGMAGTFPAAEDIQEFWKNLAVGKNCITEIPAARWAIDGFYDSNQAAIDRSVSKWGGFLSHVDQFDPLFFNISGREAERMDPQQRVFLEQAWHALEHAGYSGQALSQSRCGLFVGTSGGDYYLKLRDAGIANDGFVFTGNQPSILAGRLAYFLNLKGPALAVDTACSSSLVAIHLACQSIRSGESDMALAGGVFINTTPTFHLLCSKAGMLSPSGQCKAFDDRADGFVPGEGAGVLVLKSLERALADGDQIYGVILGSGTNQDGKTNGITAPSAVSQTSLERNVYERHNIDPSTITYIETHGTGTKLGDPIEVDALCAAFQSYTKRTGFCALGSVKTNIGHSATAAGIASAIKVLLSFENEAIPPSLNFEHENAQLHLAETPFFVNSKLTRWERGRAPRRAAISSFGFSGTNCHLVMEESPVVQAKHRSSKPALLFTLSAKTANALQKKRAQLLEWLEAHRECDLGAVSFTLNVGRDHFEYRTAFVANTVDELIDVLRDQRGPGSLNSQTTDIERLFVLLRTESSAPEYRAHLATLANQYAQGQNVNWLRLYDGLKPQRTALPLYPFERQQYWIPDAKKLQPISDKSFQISCDELFLKDHVIDGHSILPAAIYLEWARSTARGQSKTDAIAFRDSVWTLPFKVNGVPRQAIVETQSGAAGERIVLRSNEGVHFETHAGALARESIAPLDLTSIRQRCSKVFRSKELYELFASHGIRYGKSFQTISELRVGEQEAIAALTAAAPEDRRWGWPPGLLDGALQTVVVLIEQHITGINTAFVPYGVEVLEIYSDSLPEKIVAHARLVEARENRFRFNIDILDEIGVVLLRIRGFGVRQLSPKKDQQSGARKPEDTSSGNLQAQAEELLRGILAAELKIPPHAIRAHDSFEKFGIDSLMIEEFNELLQKNFGPVSKTLFFECRTLQELANHFVQNHAGSLHRLLKLDREIVRSEVANETVEGAAIHRSEVSTPQRDEPIAIIGMSGRFPQAASVEEFWTNLRDGRDCITEIPPERWDCARDFSSDPKADGKVYSKWGGFIGEYDCFDPLFFKISPQEAELMDPQERHFLEIAYATIEDAGYTPASLRERSGQSRHKDVGVFVGVMWGDYQLYGAEDPNNRAPLPWSAYWSIANRVSYTFDFKGPSLAIDTACSSSLTAIHLACESLQRGQCRAAIAGGVNLSLHPNKYRQLCQMKFASTDGKCRSFGAGGDGYVPGEGAGAVLLKPLSSALADGDHVYGVIKATGLNHGGKTNGYSVPNPIAQAELIEDVLERSTVPAETIGFIEAHGTGTALGDPIEVTGLTRAFRKFTAKSQFCTLGSAKANIGHLEAAAGVTALIKVLLQMQHRELPPSLHVETLNPNLSLEETPFKIRRELAEWVQPVHNGKIEPRRAGVSSFGAGGANAHIVVEELPEMRPIPKASQTELIILSARTKEQLLKKAGQLKTKLETYPDTNLAGLASTLQIGREAMDWRFAVCVSDTGDLSRKLEVLLGEGGKDLDIGDGKALAEEIDAEEEVYLESLYKHRKLEKLGKLWAGGRNVDWMRLKANEAPQVRISLPTYPFARDRHWIPKPRPSASEPIADHSGTVLPEDAYYTTQWISSPLINTNGYHSKGGVQLLLFDDSTEFAAQWEQVKNGSTLEIRVVTKATDHPSATGKNFSIRPGVQADYQWLVDRLLEEKFTPTDVVLLWSYRAPEQEIHLVSGTSNMELLTLFYITKSLQSSFYTNSIRLQHVFRNGTPFDIAVSGFGRSLERETPNYKIKSLQMDGAPFAPEELRQIIWKEIHGSFANGEIRYDGNGRLARETISVPQSATSVEVGFRRGGVYVITGGLGELGTEFARLLSEHYSARIVLLGRSPLNQEREKKLDALRALGAQVEYLQTDLSNRDQLNDALKKTRENCGAIHGILHLACVVEDALLYRKTSENFGRVLAPKIEGTLYLDELTKNDALDFFVSFSSAVSLTGNAGQVDYAAACRFQDAFAEYRNELSVKGMRSGRSLTIAWSQWEKAGHFASRTMLEAGGIKLLSIEHGWEALHACLGKTGNFYAVIDGDRGKINKLLRIQSDGVDRAPFSEPELSEEEIDIQLRDLFTDGSAEDIELVRGLIPIPSRNGNGELVISRTRSGLTSAMGQIEEALKDRLKLVLQPSDRRKPLTDFGLDSINAVKLADDLQKRLGLEVNPKIFWDSPTLEALAAALDAELNKEVYP